VYLSLPCVVDRGGVERYIHLDLNPKEEEGLRQSAGVLKKILGELGV
jgi:malate/lactate dehydrogenase